MAGLSHLRDVYDKRGKDFLEGLLNKTVIVNEKMDGAFFGAQKNEETGKSDVSWITFSVSGIHGANVYCHYDG